MLVFVLYVSFAICDYYRYFCFYCCCFSFFLLLFLLLCCIYSFFLVAVAGVAFDDPTLLLLSSHVLSFPSLLPQGHTAHASSHETRPANSAWELQDCPCPREATHIRESQPVTPPSYWRLDSRTKEEIVWSVWPVAAHCYVGSCNKSTDVTLQCCQDFCFPCWIFSLFYI